MTLEIGEQISVTQCAAGDEYMVDCDDGRLPYRMTFREACSGGVFKFVDALGAKADLTVKDHVWRLANSAPAAAPAPPIPPDGAADVGAAVEAKPLESDRTNRTAKSGGRSKGNDDYLTPSDFLAVLSKMGPIELDPAGAVGGLIWPTREYLPERGEDGLALSWRVKMGALVFCNPPYSQARRWIEKADAEHRQHLSEIFLLVAARTETIAVQAMRARCVCFWRGRLTFLDPVTGPPRDRKGKPAGAMFPSMVVYWGLREARFREVFAEHGRVVRWTVDLTTRS